MFYRMDSIKKETKPWVLMKQFAKLNIAVVILTVIKAHQVMAAYIYRKI